MNEPAPNVAPQKLPSDPPALQMSAFREANAGRNIWRVDVAPDLKPQDLCNAAYWANVARQLRHGDKIEAECEDASWYAEYFVTDAGVNYARVKLLASFKLESGEPGTAAGQTVAGYSVKWGGIREKYRVIRDADAKVLHTGCQSKGEAYGWLERYARTTL